jgi:hypothetical protein
VFQRDKGVYRQFNILQSLSIENAREQPAKDKQGQQP